MQNKYYRKVSAMVLTLMITASAAAAMNAAPTISADEAMNAAPTISADDTSTSIVSSDDENDDVEEESE